MRLIQAPERIELGETGWIEVEAASGGAITVAVPFGAGLSIESTVEEAVPPGSRARFLVRADRPHAVNLNRLWELSIKADGECLRVPIAVPDPSPGRTFYLLTQDCETFDGGPATGNYAGAEQFGNRNNFMDPEDYRVQMIRKPQRMNEIADRHGALWTHFYTATQRFAAEWAAGQSSTGEWDRIIAEMDGSVREGSRRHEYAPHMHFDYEPDSAREPQPRLIYDRETDGILPNDYYHPETNPKHHFHDWDGTARGMPYLKKLGDWRELDSKAGSLRKSMRHLSRLQAGRRAPLVARTGSYDFGEAAQDQSISTAAYVANGLRGNSDFYRPGSAPSPGGQMFWCAEDNRRQSITDLRRACLVQLGITKNSVFRSAQEMNTWFAAEREACRGEGVHAVLFTTHGMFLAGAPDPYRSLEGGAFEALDQHLAWVTANYPDVEFATASEAVLEFLDYYTPVLEAWAEQPMREGDPEAGQYSYAVRLLGRGIRVDEMHPATVRVGAPTCFSPEELSEVRLWQRGEVVAVECEFDQRMQPGVSATLTNRSPLRLEVTLRAEAAKPHGEWMRPSPREG